MDFREFVQKAASAVTLFNDLDNLYSTVDKSTISKIPASKLDALFIEQHWISGGITGSNCYGSKPTSVDPDSPIDITPDLAKVLMAVDKGDINFLTYVTSVQPLIKSIEVSTNPDWYHNYYSHSRVYVNLKELYDVLYVE